jgi:hypothetical protein
MVDRLGRQPELDRLRPPKDSMLTARKLENRPIQAMRVALTAYIAVNATRTTSAVGITLPHCCL